MKQIVLLVHPDQTRLEALVDLLEAEDLRCLTARSGSEALATAASYAPHVALVTANLADVQGTDVCLRLKQEDATMATRVILMSDNPADEERFVSSEVGADDYVPESSSNEELVQRIQGQMRPVYEGRRDDLSSG